MEKPWNNKFKVETANNFEKYTLLSSTETQNQVSSFSIN